jgi:hypothetical protein
MDWTRILAYITVSVGPPISSCQEGRTDSNPCGPSSCRELLKQCFGFFEDRRVQTFGEPAVDRRE